MSTKPRGTRGPVPELTKLKLLWRDSLDAPRRDFWRSQFSGTATQAQLRALLQREHSIKLTRDNQLTEFRQWVEAQDAMDAEAERQVEEETRLRNEHPDWDAERLRSEVIAASMRRALVSGDFGGLGLKAVRAGQHEKVIALDRAKFEFDAARACLAKLPELQEVRSRPRLSDDEKAAAIQQILFPR